MVKEALFLAQASFDLGQTDGRFLGVWKTWETQKEFKGLCRAGIRLAERWLRWHVFGLHDIYIDNMKLKKPGWGARKFLKQYHSNPKADIRSLEQSLRHSLEYWYPKILRLYVTGLMKVPSITEIVIGYARSFH